MVRGRKIVKEPKHLGNGWIGFNFEKPLGKPVHVINDAAMQALGSYRGGRMLFLGLGTGLGSALALDGMLFPLELGDLPYRDRDIIENFLGIPGIERLGEDEWKREVIFAVIQLKKSFIADYVVLGGGNVHRFDQLPDGIERGKNENAFLGGLRLWGTPDRWNWGFAKVTIVEPPNTGCQIWLIEALKAEVPEGRTFEDEYRRRDAEVKQSRRALHGRRRKQPTVRNRISGRSAIPQDGFRGNWSGSPGICLLSFARSTLGVRS